MVPSYEGRSNVPVTGPGLPSYEEVREEAIWHMENKLRARLVPRIYVMGGMALLIYLLAFIAESATATLLPLPQPVTSQPPIEQSLNQEERKLQLEIEKLEQDVGTLAHIRLWLPAGSAVVALAAASFGAYQYFHDKHRETDIHLQEQFSSSYAKVAEYAQQERKTSARLLAALTTLKEVVKLSRTPDDHRSKVTEVIIAEVMHDIDFRDRLQARFDLLCLEHWPDYRSWLGKHSAKQEYLMNRYIEALRALVDQYPKYFTEMSFEGNAVRPPFLINESDFLHFQGLVNGYRAHLALCAVNVRAARIEDFGKTINNPSLARQILLTSFRQESPD